MSAKPSAAIIGAGLAGLSAGQQLNKQGWQVQVFDKSRGSGGRMASKRLAEGNSDMGNSDMGNSDMGNSDMGNSEMGNSGMGNSGMGNCDMGAQFFTARQEEFIAALDQWQEQGWVAPWNSAPVKLSLSADGRPQISQYDSQRARYVGVQRMSALTRHLCEPLQFQPSTRISQIERSPAGWYLGAQSSQQDTEVNTVNTKGPFDLLIIAVPPAQAEPLLAQAGAFATEAAKAQMHAGWSAIYQAAPQGLGFEAAFVEHPIIDWLANNSSKPGRSAAPQYWCLQTRADWSDRNTETPKEQIQQQLQDSLGELLGAASQHFNLVHLHRWLYAKTAQPLGTDFLYDEMLKLGVCGDWLRGARVEDAFLSGHRLGKHIQTA